MTPNPWQITTVEKSFPSGAWQVRGFDDTDHLIVRTYYGYTKREAVAMFNREGKGRL